MGSRADLMRLLFPGFVDNDVIYSRQVHGFVAVLAASIYGRLKEEIVKALQYRSGQTQDAAQREREADRLTTEFMEAIPGIRGLLQTDVVATYEGDPAAIQQRRGHSRPIPDWKPSRCSGWRTCFTGKHVPLIPRIMTEFAHSRTGN